jgi:ApaG protein
MRGSYFCVAEDGTRFEVEIAAFILDADTGSGGAPRVLH